MSMWLVADSLKSSTAIQTKAFVSEKKKQLLFIMIASLIAILIQQMNHLHARMQSHIHSLVHQTSNN
jgi:hypothetical protein